MPSRTPYLQRRGDAFFFRIAVPADLRLQLQCYEITKSLQTSSRDVATIRALQVAAHVKRHFREVREMAKSGKSSRDDNRLNYEVMWDEDERGRPRVRVKAEPHETEAVAVLVSKVRAASAPFAGSSAAILPPISNETAPAASPPKSGNSLTLGEVVDEFLAGYSAKKQSMLKKLQANLRLLVQVLGKDVPIASLKRKMFVEYLELVCKLPPKWAAKAKRERLTARDIAAQSQQVCLSEATFKGSYKTSVSIFLEWAHENHREEGFPEISIRKVEYLGTRSEAENRQRAMTDDELRLLFTGPKMAELAADPRESEKCWLPLLGLFTGARINEICQLNPHTDIWLDKASGYWACRFTTITESAEHIEKTIKNRHSKRSVPLHPKLIALGFVDYVKALRDANLKCLLTSFKVWRKRASSQAQKWFNRWLDDVGLRDDTPGARVVGMHALRSTFANRAQKANVDESDLVGHTKRGATASATNYRGERDLLSKYADLERIIAQFDLNFIKPSPPVITDVRPVGHTGRRRRA